MKLVIADKDTSSWSLRPWLLLTHAGIPFEELVMLFDRAEWREEIVALSPSRRVPALHDGDLLIWDSLAICEYLAEEHPELWPRDANVRAIARAVSAEMHAGFASMRNELPMYVTTRAPRQTRSTETTADVARVKQIWSQSLAASGGPFLFGDFSIADAMYAPVVFRFRTYDVAIEDAAARAWYERMLALPAMRAWEDAAKAETLATKRGLPATGSAIHAWVLVATGRISPKTDELAAKQPGCLGVESARNPDGFGVSVSYWHSPEAVRLWRELAERNDFDERYEVRVCTVDKGYKFP